MPILKIRKGLEENLPVLDDGEPGFTTDTHKLFIGQGSTNYQIGGSSGEKNFIINGDMRIAQRGTSFAAIANNAYFLDRWVYGKVSSAEHTITQDVSVPTEDFGYSFKLDCTTADSSVDSSDVVYVEQKVEGYNFRAFKGKTATLSFWVKSGKTGTMCISFRNEGSDRSYVSEVVISSANTWEYKSVAVTFDYSGGTWNYGNGTGIRVSFVLMCGSTYQTTADSWQSGNYCATSSQTNFCDNTDSTCDVYITGVQLEEGGTATATAFEHRDYASELVRCQRYYSRHTAIGGAYSRFVLMQKNTTTEFFGIFYLPTFLRAAPTLATSGTFEVWGSAGSVDVSSFSLSSATESSVLVGANLSATTTDATVILRAKNDATAYLEFIAEI